MADTAAQSVVVMGSTGVGKTTIIRHFISDSQSTVGSDGNGSIYRKVLTMERFCCNIEVVEINGMSNVLRRRAVDQGDAFILVFSVSDENSFKAVQQLRKRIMDARGAHKVPVIVVGMEMGHCSSSHRIKSIRQIIEVDWGASFFLINGCINRWVVKEVFDTALKLRN